MNDVEQRLARLHFRGLIDFHFDLPMELYEKRDSPDLFTQKFLPELRAGNIAAFVAAIYIEDKYLPGKAREVALGQMECIKNAVERSGEAAICRTHVEIERARASGKIAIIFGMEGAEPIGEEAASLKIFYDAGLRLLGLTHSRVNAAAHGAIFAPSGSSPKGLTNLGRELITECEGLGIIIDLAHINPAGFEEIVSITEQPPVVSHSNARRYYDIERNVSDEQVKMVGARNGVIGVNSILVSSVRGDSTLDRYVDHIEHIAGLIGIDGVGIGFDFFKFIYCQWPVDAQRELGRKLTEPRFMPDLSDHTHAPNLVRKLIERGFSDADIEKILFGNWDRILRAVL